MLTLDVSQYDTIFILCKLYKNILYSKTTPYEAKPTTLINTILILTQPSRIYLQYMLNGLSDSFVAAHHPSECRKNGAFRFEGFRLSPGSQNGNFPFSGISGHRSDDVFASRTDECVWTRKIS